MNDFAKRLGRITLAAVLLVTGAWGQIISQYIETNSGSYPKGIEIWNNTESTLDFSSNNLVVQQGTNGAAPSTVYTLSLGTLTSGSVIVIGTTGAPSLQTVTESNGATFYNYNFAFNGDDALVIKYGGTTTDVFGDPGTGDPGTGWAGNGVQTYNQNIQLKIGITTGDTDGWTDPSARFEIVSTDPFNNQTGFGLPPLSPEPTTQASSLSFTDVGETGMTINWTPGNGSNRIVIVKAGSAVDSPPVDGTSYTASTTFGSGTQIGTGNYVVYNGTGSSVAITGLSAGTTYHVAIAEFNGSGGAENYLTDSPLTGNQATDAGSRPANPSNIVWDNTTTSQSFEWTLNGNSDPVLLLYSENDDITAPVDGVSYTAGEFIDNAEVLYVGTNTSYTHTDLDPGTVYYYGIYSVDASDIYSTGLLGPGMTLKLEPSNHVTNFTASSVGYTELSFTWSDNDGANIADAFMIVLEKTQTLSPSDGNVYHSEESRWVEYVNHGVQTVTFDSLDQGSTYYARIWPLSNYDFEPAKWDYKTGGTIPEITQATLLIPTPPFAVEFDYPVDSKLTDFGWTAHSGGGTNPIRTVSPGLEFSGYPSSGIGNAADVGNTGEDVHLAFEEITAGTVYASFIIKTGATNAAGYFLHLGHQNISTTFFSRVWVNATGDGVGIGANAPSTYVPINAGTPTLLVIKYTIGTKESALFVFNSMPTSEPETADAYFTETATITGVGSIALRQYSASQDIIVDGIRIATSWNDAPLPICLASFTAEAVNGKVHVSWVTESETENAAFRIYRDGAMIAEIEGAGTSTEPHSYAYTDQYVIPGRTYSYQLADVSFDGEETRHNEVKVEVKVEGVDRDYSIGAAYPNPFNPLTIVPLNLAKDANVHAQLYDMLGRPVRDLHKGNMSAGSHALKIDGSALSTGIYFVHVRVNDATHVQKIALMK